MKCLPLALLTFFVSTPAMAVNVTVLDEACVTTHLFACASAMSVTGRISQVNNEKNPVSKEEFVTYIRTHGLERLDANEAEDPQSIEAAMYICRNLVIPIVKPSCVVKLDIPSQHELSEALKLHTKAVAEAVEVQMKPKLDEVHGLIDRLNDITGAEDITPAPAAGP